MNKQLYKIMCSAHRVVHRIENVVDRKSTTADYKTVLHSFPKAVRESLYDPFFKDRVQCILVENALKNRDSDYTKRILRVKRRERELRVWEKELRNS